MELSFCLSLTESKVKSQQDKELGGLMRFVPPVASFPLESRHKILFLGNKEQIDGPSPRRLSCVGEDDG